MTPTGNATGYYPAKTIQTWHGRALIVTRGDGELKIEVQ